MIKEDAPLIIKLDHKGPIALDDFSGALDRLAKRYARFQRPQGKEESSELFISRIREGSVELSLVGTALAAQASIEAAGGLNNVIEFGRNLASLFQSFKEKSEPSSQVTISDCDDVRAIMKPVITTNGGGLIISVAGDGNIIKLDQQDAREIDNRAALERSKISTPTEDIASEVLFVWDKIRDAPAIAAGKHSPDRGIITASIKGLIRSRSQIRTQRMRCT